MGGGVGVLEAPALVDRHVDQDRARLHRRDEFVGDQLGGLGPRDEDGADDQIGLGDVVGDRQGGAGHAAHLVVETPEGGAKAA